MVELKPKPNVICHRVVRGRDWQQEVYCTMARHARKRASELRKLGFKVTTSALGYQITNSGRVKLTMLTVHDLDYGTEVPPPARIERCL